MAENEDVLRPHSYDGIEEYDNPLPGWWTALFVGSILFSAVYLFYYHAGAQGRRVYDDYDRDMAANLRLQFAEIGELKPDHATIVEYMGKDNWLKVGETVFKANCVSCHGTEGQGLVGPNLHDENYKNVKVLEDVARVISDGAAGQAMPAWKNRLHPNEVVLAAAYVAKMRGAPLSVSGRAPEGNVIPPWNMEATPPATETAPAEPAPAAPVEKPAGGK